MIRTLKLVFTAYLVACTAAFGKIPSFIDWYHSGGVYEFAGDGDGQFEPGEVIGLNVEVINSAVLDSTERCSLTVTSDEHLHCYEPFRIVPIVEPRRKVRLDDVLLEVQPTFRGMLFGHVELSLANDQDTVSFERYIRCFSELKDPELPDFGLADTSRWIVVDSCMATRRNWMDPSLLTYVQRFTFDSIHVSRDVGFTGSSGDNEFWRRVIIYSNDMKNLSPSITVGNLSERVISNAYSFDGLPVRMRMKYNYIDTLGSHFYDGVMSRGMVLEFLSESRDSLEVISVTVDYMHGN